MRDPIKRVLWTAAYAVAMALMEAAVVVYIRALLDITSDHVGLDSYVRIEIWREATTLVMLVAFGLWDIGYYVWLKVLLGWPETLLDWDILFMIPVRWWGPVLAPVLIAGLICATAVLAVLKMDRGKPLKITRTRVTTAALGALLALYVFMSDSIHALIRGQPDWNTLRPEAFKWPLFLVALALMAVPSLITVWPQQKPTLEDETA